MALTKESVTFEAALDASKFNGAMSKMRSEVDKTGAAVTNTSKKFDNAAKSTQTMSKSTLGLGTRLKNFEPIVGKAASGMSGMAGAMGGAVGQTNAMGGAIAGIAGAFAGGGLLAVGIGGVTLLLGGLVEKWFAVGEAAKKAKEKQEQAGKDMGTLLRMEIKKLNEETFELETGQKAWKLSLVESKIEYDQISESILKNETKLAAQEDLAERTGLRRYAIKAEQIREELEQQTKKHDELGMVMTAVATNVDAYNDAFKRNIAAKKAAKEATEDLTEEEVKLKGAIKDNKELLDDMVSGEDDYRDFFALHGRGENTNKDRMMEEWKEFDYDNAEREKMDAIYSSRVDAQYELEQEAAKEHLEKLRELRKKESDDMKAHMEVYIAVGKAIAISAYATSMDVLERMAAGEKVALDEMLAIWISTSMRAAGTSIFGDGLAYFVKGALMAVGSGGTAGSHLMAAGGAAMGLGISLGAAGSIGMGLTARQFGASGKGSPIELPHQAAGENTPGVNVGTGTGSRGGAAEETERSVYIFNAPVYGDETASARNTARLQRIARDDLLERV